MCVTSTFIHSLFAQIELFEAAKERNTLVCLGTGTGKTFIAVMLIKHFAYQIREAFSAGGQRTIFLVPEVCLVAQQAKVIESNTDLKVGQVIGAMNVDTWSKETWLDVFDKFQVVVMTAEIFRIIAAQGIVPLSKINLIVFDEVSFRVVNAFADCCCAAGPSLREESSLQRDHALG